MKISEVDGHLVKTSADAERRRLSVAVERGVLAFRAQEWARVVQLLEPHEAELSPRMARKLAQARDSGPRN